VKCLRVGCEKDKILRKKKKEAQNKTTTALIETSCREMAVVAEQYGLSSDCGHYRVMMLN